MTTDRTPIDSTAIPLRDDGSPDTAAIAARSASPQALTLSTRDLDLYAQRFAASRLFSNTSADAAFTKIAAGLALGIPPFAAMTAFQLIDGKPTLSAAGIAGLIEASPKYDYTVEQHTKEVCVIAFYRLGRLRGRSTFTLADAKAAGLSEGVNWKKYPTNMLFARAISNGQKWYCPDLTFTALYTPDELGADIDGETGEYVPPTRATVTTAPSPPTAYRQQDDADGRRRFWARAKDSGYTTQAAAHEALGLGREPGALGEWLDESGLTWAGALTELERATAARAVSPEAPPSTAAPCPDCGYALDECACGQVVAPRDQPTAAAAR